MSYKSVERIAMKKVLLGMLVLSGMCVIYAFSGKKNSEIPNKNVNWMSFEEAVEAVEQEREEGLKPKKIFIDVFTDWCGWCKKMGCRNLRIS